MKTFSILKLIIMIILFLLCYGCQDLADVLVGKKPPDAKTINITMIAKSATNPVFLSARKGAEAAAKDLSDKYSKIDIKIDWRTPQTDNAAEQAERIKTAVEDGTDAIMVSCSDDSILTEAINFAVDNGVLVMTFDSDASASKRFAFYGPNDVEIGQNVMDELAAVIGETGQVAILGGQKSAPNLQKRIQGVKSAAEKYPNIEIVGEFYHPENAEDAINAMLTAQAQYPQIKGWAMVGGWPFFIQELPNKIDLKDIRIVAVDALPVQLSYIKNGTVDVFLGQPTFKWGEFPVRKIIDKLYLGKEVEEINQMKLIRVTIDNLGGWSRQLRAWGYEGVPMEYLTL